MNDRGKTTAARRSGKKIDKDPYSLNSIPRTTVKKNPIHSVITTLPVIMLICGLWFYFSGEKQQRNGEPILSEMIEVSGGFSGMSEQSKKPNAQRIIWIKTPERLRGGRLDLQQYGALQGLKKDQAVRLWLAPRVEGSNLLWVVKAQADEQVYFDLSKK